MSLDGDIQRLNWEWQICMLFFGMVIILCVHLSAWFPGLETGSMVARETLLRADKILIQQHSKSAPWASTMGQILSTPYYGWKNLTPTGGDLSSCQHYKL